MSFNNIWEKNFVEAIDPKLFRCATTLFSPITINVSKYCNKSPPTDQKRPTKIQTIPSNDLRTSNHTKKANKPTFKKGVTLDHSSVNYHQFKMMERIENFLKMSNE